MEAKKSHDELSATWRTRKAGGVIQSESEGLKSGRGRWCESRSESENSRTRSTSVQGEEKMGISAQAE